MFSTIPNRVYKKQVNVSIGKGGKQIWRKVLNKFEENSEQPVLKSCLWLVAFKSDNQTFGMCHILVENDESRLNQWTAFNNSVPHYKDAHWFHHRYYLDEKICAVSLANQLTAVAFHFLETCQCSWTSERWTSYSLLHEI